MARVGASGAAERLRRFIDENRDTPEWELESVLLDINEGLWAAMQVRRVSRSDLADRLGTSRAYVTKLLDGQENMTLKTLVRVANALDMRVATKLVPRERAAKRVKEQRAKPVAVPKKRAAAAPAAGAPAKRVAVAARSKR